MNCINNLFTLAIVWVIYLPRLVGLVEGFADSFSKVLVKTYDIEQITVLTNSISIITIILSFHQLSRYDSTEGFLVFFSPFLCTPFPDVCSFLLN